MNLNEIDFPVYKLGDEKPSVEDGVIYYYFGKLEIIDDLSLEGENLGLRRARISDKDKFKLKMAIFYVADLIKLSSPRTWFIDSSGKLFQYKKSKSVKLVSKKIIKVIKCVGYCLIEVQGVLHRFKTLYPPSENQKYASLLVLNRSYLLYGFSNEEHATTWRKI